MKVTEIFRELDDCRNSFCIEINGELKASFYDGEPEDNTINRNFNDVLNIVELMEMAYNAGVNDEPFDLEERDLNGEEEDD